MSITYKKWRNVFLICFGLFISAAFCMKWMENDFRLNGNLFTIIGLEISYSKEKIIAIFSEIDSHVRTIIGYHLSFDFIFMAGVYPGIAALCMMAREKRKNPGLKKLLHFVAMLQLLAWGCDIAENLYLFKWLNDPEIGNEFILYHTIVLVKWVIALSGAFIAIPLAIKRSRV